MNTYRIKSAIAAIIIAGCWASPAFACGDKGKSCPLQSDHYGKHYGKSGKHAIPGDSPGYLRMIVKGADKLGLTEKQRKTIGELLVKAQADAATAHAQSEVAVAAFKSKLYSGKATAKDVKSYSQRLGELRAASLSARLLPSLRAKGLLNDEQREKLTAMHRGGKNWRGKEKQASYGKRHASPSTSK